MASKIYSFKIRPDFILDITFFNGDVKRFYFKEWDDFFMDEHEFNQVSIDKSKMHLSWENGKKIDNTMLWYNSVLIETIDIDDVAIRFAERMRRMRESVWMTQKQLEEKTGIYQADISKLERGEANPSLSTMQRIAEGMGYDLQFFSTARSTDGPYTIDDILEMEDDKYAELIDGVIYEMATPLFIHQEIISYINAEFIIYIRNNRGKCKVHTSATGVMFEDNNKNFFIPDLLVLCDSSKIKKYGIVGGPDFILEVVSSSSAKNDYHKKLDKYADLGVREYWIIDPFKKCLVKYFLEDEACPEVHFFNETVEVSIYGGKLAIDLSEIGRIVESEYKE